MKLIFLSLILIQTAFANTSLHNAVLAQTILGSGIRSEVIRINNTSSANGYPKTFFALVFELENILWFYTDYNGTQSLSKRYGTVQADRQDYLPLLQDIHPSLVGWTRIPETGLTLDVTEYLPNGCFVRSVAIAQSLSDVSSMQLVACYTSLKQAGHTVLTYKQDKKYYVIDPERPHLVQTVPQWDTPLQLARHLYGSRVAQARIFPLSLVS